MTRKFAPCLPLPSETVWDRGNTKIRLCSRLCWKLSCAPNLLEMFCSVCGWWWWGGRGGEGEWGFSNVCYIQHIWKRMEKASPSGFVNRIGPEGAVAVTHADSPLCGFCLEQRKPAFKAFNSLWQLYMRILLKHLTQLCIQCHINLAHWLTATPAVAWATSTGHAQATRTGSLR